MGVSGYVSDEAPLGKVMKAPCRGERNPGFRVRVLCHVSGPR